MGVWRKLVTAVKGGANEAATAVVDSQALRILDQEIREAKEELRKSDQARTKVLAKVKLSQGKVDALKSSITEYEGHARKHAATDKDLALECAQKVSELREQLDTEQSYLDQYATSEKTLAKNIKQAKDNLRRLEQQVDMVKATESVQKAQTAVSSSHAAGNSRMKTASESLERIQEKQKQRSAELEAAEEIAASESGADLDARLKSSTVMSSDDELARILAGN
jgi:phage shock protein A